ncbi:hypothetical protein [Alienimonas chondri]|uniref:Uncharacterized protein n=1 Tax=Alienimonas chondri TaxID=2681879 RepID=A0ABX1VD47_9PLAN|nr:hypothetical protein [Alienimonas chondri]NNJ26034.1 hypothetical protein [Alienimonas chondri]
MPNPSRFTVRPRALSGAAFLALSLPLAGVTVGCGGHGSGGMGPEGKTMEEIIAENDKWSDAADAEAEGDGAF